MDMQAFMSEMGVSTIPELHKRMNEMYSRYQKNIDSMYLAAGSKPHFNNITLTEPEFYFHNVVSVFAASVNIPLKMLIGTQTGERASTEDQKSFNATISSRRTDIVDPILMSLLAKLKAWNAISTSPWTVRWSDISLSTAKERAERVKLLADVSKIYAENGAGLPFSVGELREIAGLPAEIDLDSANTEGYKVISE